MSYPDLNSLRPDIPRTLQIATRQHQAIEEAIGQVFITRYGRLLHPDQIQFFQSAFLPYEEEQRPEEFREVWILYEPVDIHKATINNTLYVGYRPAHLAIKPQAVIIHFDQADHTLKQTKHRIDPLYVGAPVDMCYIDLERVKIYTPTTSILQGYAQFLRAAASSEYAGIVIHEKTHIIQDPDLPLPLREAHAYFIQREIIKSVNGTEIIEPAMEGLAQFFSYLYHEYGDQLHLLLFGLRTAQSSLLLAEIKNKLTKEAIVRLLPHNFQWITRDMI